MTAGHCTTTVTQCLPIHGRRGRKPPIACAFGSAGAINDGSTAEQPTRVVHGSGRRAATALLGRCPVASGDGAPATAGQEASVAVDRGRGGGRAACRVHRGRWPRRKGALGPGSGALRDDANALALPPEIVVVQDTSSGSQLCLEECLTLRRTYSSASSKQTTFQAFATALQRAGYHCDTFCSGFAADGGSRTSTWRKSGSPQMTLLVFSTADLNFGAESEGMTLDPARQVLPIWWSDSRRRPSRHAARRVHEHLYCP